MGIDSNYIVITNPRHDLPCWVNKTDIELYDLDITGMPIYTIPAVEDAADSPEMECWVPSTRTGNPICVKPCPDPSMDPSICKQELHQLDRVANPLNG